MEYHILASGSKGNSAFIYEDNTGILIDCGISKKQLLYKLSTLGFSIDDIDYVLLTHDHYDHNKNIHVFDTKKVYAGKGCIKEERTENVLVPYQEITLKQLNILPLALSHDATSPLGFVIHGKEKLLYLTDSGYISQKNMGYIENMDYYIIESNHDVEMLMETRRPIFLKNRIYGDEGHLNNEYSAQAMVKVIGQNTKEIVLAHLSEEANSPEIALETYRRVFEEENCSFTNVRVASQVNIVSGGNKRVS